MSVIFSRAVCGRALSCCRRTPVEGNPRRFVLMAGWRWFSRRSVYELLLVTVVPRCVQCSKRIPFSSRESRHDVPGPSAEHRTQKSLHLRTINLLLWQTDFPIPDIHSAINVLRFHTFTLRKSNHRALSSLVHEGHYLKHSYQLTDH